LSKPYADIATVALCYFARCLFTTIIDQIKNKSKEKANKMATSQKSNKNDRFDSRKRGVGIAPHVSSFFVFTFLCFCPEGRKRLFKTLLQLDRKLQFFMVWAVHLHQVNESSSDRDIFGRLLFFFRHGSIFQYSNLDVSLKVDVWEIREACIPVVAKLGQSLEVSVFSDARGSKPASNRIVEVQVPAASSSPSQPRDIKGGLLQSSTSTRAIEDMDGVD
jgi:hypothetical protein